MNGRRLQIVDPVGRPSASKSGTAAHRIRFEPTQPFSVIAPKSGTLGQRAGILPRLRRLAWDLRWALLIAGFLLEALIGHRLLWPPVQSPSQNAAYESARTQPGESIRVEGPGPGPQSVVGGRPRPVDAITRDTALEGTIRSLEAGRMDEALSMLQRYARMAPDPAAQIAIQLLQQQLAQRAQQR